jgi:hypothetical protein
LRARKELSSDFFRALDAVEFNELMSAIYEPRAGRAARHSGARCVVLTLLSRQPFPTRTCSRAASTTLECAQLRPTLNRANLGERYEHEQAVQRGIPARCGEVMPGSLSTRVRDRLERAAF